MDDCLTKCKEGHPNKSGWKCRTDSYDTSFTPSSSEEPQGPVPASTWKSGGSCPAGCSEPICVDGNCKDITVNGTVYKGCSGTCKNSNNKESCRYDNQCTVEACGVKYFNKGDNTQCKDNQQWDNSMWNSSGSSQPVQGAMQNGTGQKQQPTGQQQPTGSMTQSPSSAVKSNFARPTNFTLFNEKILQQVLANKNLIPEDIPLNAEDKSSLIRVGKSFMLDVAKIRNLVLPNIKQNDYEMLGRIVSKHLKDKEDGATRSHLDVTKSRIMNTVQALLSSTELNSSIIQNGTIPQSQTSNRTTGMMSDKTNAYMTGKGNYDFAKGMNGMSGKYTDSYKPTNDTINPKPYDSVWSVFY